MKIGEALLRHGGLMRCCIKTALDYQKEHAEEEVDELVLDCTYEAPGNCNLLLREGFWQYRFGPDARRQA